MGVLRSKMGELTTEINRLRQETVAATEEQSTFLAYDKRVKELAGELTGAQGVLADYNLLVDKLNTDSERSEVTTEVAELKLQNEAEQQVNYNLKQGRAKGYGHITQFSEST